MDDIVLHPPRLLRRETDRFVKAAALSSALPHAETVMTALQRDGGAELETGARGPRVQSRTGPKGQSAIR